MTLYLSIYLNPRGLNVNVKKLTISRNKKSWFFVITGKIFYVFICFQIGVTSFRHGLGCDSNMPSAYARVTSFMDFINNHI